jgi:hypothetical protein
MKPGYKTTEFWTTVASQGLALLTVVGVLSTADAANLGGEISKAITAASVLAVSGWNVVSYIKSRTQIKAGQ